MQARIRLEAEAVLIILAQCEAGQWEWIGSEVVHIEIDRTPDPERRRRVRSLTFHVHHLVTVGQPEAERAQQLELLGIATYDALHLACAESEEVDVFLTTDDRLLRKSVALKNQLRVRVENPLVWLGERS
jgi:predicted nucleic acid-binding protein